MKIRPPSGGHSDIGRTSGPHDRKPRGKFSVNKGPDVGAADAEAQVDVRLPWASQYRKVDLHNPARKEEVVLHAANHLVNLSFGSSTQLPDSVRQIAAEVLAEDPVFRDRLMSFLERTLD